MISCLPRQPGRSKKAGHCPGSAKGYWRHLTPGTTRQTWPRSSRQPAVEAAPFGSSHHSPLLREIEPHYLQRCLRESTRCHRPTDKRHPARHRGSEGRDARASRGRDGPGGSGVRRPSTGYRPGVGPRAPCGHVLACSAESEPPVSICSGPPHRCSTYRPTQRTTRCCSGGRHRAGIVTGGGGAGASTGGASSVGSLEGVSLGFGTVTVFLRGQRTKRNKSAARHRGVGCARPTNGTAAVPTSRKHNGQTRPCHV